MADLDKPHRHDLRDDPVAVGNPFRIAALNDRNVLGFGFVAIDDGEGSPIANGRQFILDQDRIEQIEGFLFGQRIITPHVHFAAHRRARFDVNNEARRLAEIIQHLIE